MPLILYNTFILMDKEGNNFKVLVEKGKASLLTVYTGSYEEDCFQIIPTLED